MDAFLFKFMQKKAPFNFFHIFMNEMDYQLYCWIQNPLWFLILFSCTEFYGTEPTQNLFVVTCSKFTCSPHK